jgi:hypothetical protein
MPLFLDLIINTFFYLELGLGLGLELGLLLGLGLILGVGLGLGLGVELGLGGGYASALHLIGIDARTILHLLVWFKSG